MRIVSITVMCFLILTSGLALAAPKTVTYWKFTSQRDDEWIEKRIAEYEKVNPDIKIKFETVPWKDYLDKLLVAAASGTGPDIYERSNDYFQTFIEKGFTMNLYPKWVDDALLDTYVPSKRQSMAREDKVFGFGKEMEPIVVYYRKDLFDKAGLAYPSDDWTWEDMLSYAKQLTVRKSDGMVEQYGVAIPTDPGSYTTFVFYPFLWSSGGELINDDWTKSLLDQEEAIRALDYWNTLINVEKVAPPKHMQFPLVNGQVAMLVSGIWMVSEYAETAPDMQYGVVPVPKGAVRQQTVYGGWISIVNPHGKYKEEGADFLRWLYGDPKRNTDWCDWGSVLVPRNGYLEDQGFVTEEFNPGPQIVEKLKELKSKVEKSGALRAEPAYTVEMVEALSDAIQNTLFGGKAAEATMKEAAGKINDFLSKTEIKYPPGKVILGY